MSYRIPLKFALPVFAALLLMLLAAWAFGLSPVAALTERGAAAAAASPPAGDQVSGLAYDVIQVSGLGTATGTPDLAELSLNVAVVDESVVAARNTAATTMQSVRKAFTDNGILEADIATSHFRIHPNYEYGPDGREQKGYRVSNGISVKVRNVDTLGTVIDAAITAGGDHIEFNNLGFRISDTSALEREARQAAVEDMKDRAGQMAEFSGRELGDLKMVSESPIGNIGGDFLERGFAASAALAADTPISTGESDITITVFGVYELRR